MLPVFFRPWSWFRRGAPQTDYEEVLSALQEEIDHVQTNLVQIQTRKRRATIILPIWASLFWAIYTGVVYLLGWLGGAGGSGDVIVVWGPILLAPFLIFFTRRIVRWWYKRVQAAEEGHLKDLKKQRGAKIEEIKKATRYDHLRKLLDKYDNEDGAGPKSVQGTPVKGGAPGQQPQTPARSGVAPTQPNTPASMQRQPLHQPITPAMRAVNGGGPLPPPPPTIVRPPLPSAMPTERTWLDRVADAVLGSDPSSATLGPEQKYALICSNCKKHNGLATREEFDEVREYCRGSCVRVRVEKQSTDKLDLMLAEYICPHCGTFNTRRPSSVPVSSPWRTPATRDAGSATKQKSSRPSQGPSSFLRPSSRLMDDTDSPPPASPLGFHSSEDEEEEGGEQVHDLKPASQERNAAGLSQRKSAGTLVADQEDVDMQ